MNSHFLFIEILLDVANIWLCFVEFFHIFLQEFIVDLDSVMIKNAFLTTLARLQ